MQHDLKLERMLLGSFLSVQDAYVESSHLLFPEIWYQDGHRAIYEVIKYLANKNAPIDIVSGTGELKKRGELDYVGGAEYIMGITDEVFYTKESLPHHIQILTELYIKRELTIYGEQLRDKSLEPMSDIFDLISKTENKLNELNSRIHGNESDKDLKASIQRTYDHLMLPREANCTGLKTGNGELTDLLGGFNPEFYLLCGRPSMGKSSRMIQFAAQVAEQSEPVAIFSLEMTQEHQVNTKLLNYYSEVDSSLINSQSCNKEERERILWAKDRIEKLPIYINDKSHISPNYIRAIARQLQRKGGLSMIFIDYLQLMKPNEFIKGRNRDLELGDITSSLKAIVKDLKIPIMALSQLNRSLEERGNKRPQMKDLRESGNLEQDADVIMSVYRPAYYDTIDKEYQQLPTDQYEAICELGIIKHRMGGAGRNLVEYFEKSKSRFSNKYNQF